MHLSTLHSPPRAPAPVGRYLWTAAVSVLLSAVLLVMVTVRWPPLLSADRAVADRLHRSAVAHPGWTGVNRVLTDWFWDPVTMRVLMLLAVAVLAWRGRRRTAGVVLAAVLTAPVVQQGLKAAVGRPRPRWRDPVDSAHYAAFPSGHALSAALACSLLLWLLLRSGPPAWLRRAAVAVTIVSVAGVGFTRLYLGVHWLSDVLAGWLLGVALAAVSAALCMRWEEAGTGREAPLSGGT